MKSTSRTVLASLIVTTFIISGPTARAATPQPVFTPAQEARIGEVAADYLVAHPEVLVNVSQKLQEQQQERQMQAMTAAVAEHQGALLDDKGTPSYGPADAQVTVVEFFDYQCIYCARLAPVLQKVMAANPDVRFVFKALPIFETRWPESGHAAKTGLQIWLQKGADAWLHYHNTLYATGHNEGRLTDDDIRAAATAVNFDAGQAADVQGTLDGIQTLAQQLGFSGTPALVVLPSAGARAGRVTVIPGLTRADTLQRAINTAAGNPKP
ncbi:thioredoxin domain-containing protein [Citrobacter braakii]|uniref:DsbA family protein n=1 Tax=Citrobacter braakii TaxID=57706 RepID=A0A8I0G5G6_CITBR|nr:MULTISPECIES: DsbA family protein [Citrobacter]EIV2910317.1 thioredoxin domain-containing protein [Citrobacter braakii]MBD3125863.1 DsbA family protein [Citrobacter braakii]MBJ8835431.1 thioredoxin domain-containing protein [Citrobacter freundii]